MSAVLYDATVGPREKMGHRVIERGEWSRAELRGDRSGGGRAARLTLVERFFGRVYDLPPSETVARESGRHRVGDRVRRPLILVTVRALAGGGRCTVVEEIDRGPLAAWHSVPISRTVASLTEDPCA